MDTYIGFQEIRIGQKMLEILDALDYRVRLVDAGGSHRPLISNGFLRLAKARGKKTFERLRPWLDRKIPIIICEPSAFSALKEDIPDLLDDPTEAQLLASGVISIEHFLADHMSTDAANGILKVAPGPHVIHSHCHQKALEGTRYLEQIFSALGQPFHILDSSCCGMAGAFGFEKEHYDFSRNIFDTDLGKKLAQWPPDQPILASGFSCRHQIADLGKREVKHWTEVLLTNGLDLR